MSRRASNKLEGNGEGFANLLEGFVKVRHRGSVPLNLCSPSSQEGKDSYIAASNHCGTLRKGSNVSLLATRSLDSSKADLSISGMPLGDNSSVDDVSSPTKPTIMRENFDDLTDVELMVYFPREWKKLRHGNHKFREIPTDLTLDAAQLVPTKIPEMAIQRNKRAHAVLPPISRMSSRSQAVPESCDTEKVQLQEMHEATLSQRETLAQSKTESPALSEAISEDPESIEEDTTELYGKWHPKTRTRATISSFDLADAPSSEPASNPRERQRPAEQQEQQLQRSVSNNALQEDTAVTTNRKITKTVPRRILPTLPPIDQQPRTLSNEPAASTAEQTTRMVRI